MLSSVEQNVVFVIMLVSLCFAGCGEEVETGTNKETSNGTSATGGSACGSDDDCSDGVFCNGLELCEPASPSADADGCVSGTLAVDDGDACTTDRCDESSQTVLHDAIAGCDQGCQSDEDCGEAPGACEVLRCTDAGTCEPAPAPEGTACDDGIDCTEDTCDDTGVCLSASQDTFCVDTLFCNGLERCLPDEPGANAQGCVEGEPPTIEDDGIACTELVCDEESNSLTWEAGEGCGCDTPGEACADPDPNDCEVSICTEALTCEARPLEEGTACDDGMACTGSDACNVDGLCMGTPDNSVCDDAAYCNGPEFCQPDQPNANADGCVTGVPPSVPDGLDCTEDVCNEESDSFDYIAGDCGCQIDADCVPDAPNLCLVYTCNDALQCTTTPAMAGVGCDDGFACTGGDQCNGEGACEGEADDNNCNDLMYCNGQEVCDPRVQGADAEGCVDGQSPMLSDGIDCTEDTCEECDPDSEFCTPGVTGEVVHTGTDTCGCVEGADCAGMFGDQPCADPVCDAFECVAQQRSAGATCDDGVMCTNGDVCDAEGACEGTPDNAACSDQMYCNGDEVCEPGGGCVDGEDPVDLVEVMACIDLSCDEANDMVLMDDSRCNGECTDTEVYIDNDNDGFGTGDDTMTACLEEGEEVEGYALFSNDCGPSDPWRNPDAEEICGDWVDDDCDSDDEACPETTASLETPDWDCTGDPPSNVLAWARYDSGDGDGGCFAFFAATSGAFFVTWDGLRVGSRPTDITCNGFDQRLYGYTLAGNSEACDPVMIEVDFVGAPELAIQPVSNDCRKFLSQMNNSARLSYVASSREVVERRLELFPNIELACVGYIGYEMPYGWRSLNSAPIQYNPSFVQP